METPSDLDHHFPLKSPSQSFLLPNGINNTRTPFQLSDIEMVTFDSLSYTSLKDVLPASPPSIMSPKYKIPIKDPLVKHAAWAYLQPMTTPPESDHRSYFSKLMDKQCGLFGCFGGFFNDVVSTATKRLFTEGGTSEYKVD